MIYRFGRMKLSNFSNIRPPSHTHARGKYVKGCEGGRLLMGDTVAEAVLAPAVLLQRASFLHLLETGI